jgi:hypothetical protein
MDFSERIESGMKRKATNKDVTNEAFKKTSSYNICIEEA